MIIVALEDARQTNKDNYLAYIDFRNPFKSIDHARLLALTKDLGYPLDTIELVGNIHTSSTTSFVGNHFKTTLPIQIS